MFKRRKFTLIELIVVIAVLGILAAIVIPNISNFQNKARDVQLTADTRNIQTALDMYRLDQPDGVSEPILVVGSEEESEEVIITATQEYDSEGNIVDTKKYYRVLDLEKLYPNYLRQIPKYAVTNVVVTDAGTDEEKIDAATDKGTVIPNGLNFENGGKVVFAVLLETKVDDADNPVAGEKSTAIVNALSYVKDELTIVR